MRCRRSRSVWSASSRARICGASAISSARSTRYVSPGCSAAARCGSRVSQPRVQKLGRMQRASRGKRAAQRFVVLRRKCDVAGKCAEIEPGTTRDDRALPAAVNRRRSRRERRSRSAPPNSVRADRESQRGDAELPRALLAGRRGGTDRHIAVDLPRIGADDLGIECVAQERSPAPVLPLAVAPRKNQDDAVRYA